MEEVISKTAFKEAVEELIKTNFDTYKLNKKRIKSDFQAEKEITNSYNGRQLLELIQNADDAQTNDVFIQIDKEQQKLIICNNGNPFDIEGIDSLMLAFNSSKITKEYIGNKGLGFRSILNWVESVKIKTHDCVVQFSPEIARKYFEILVPEPSEREKLIKSTTKLDPGEVPFAILAIPEFEDTNEPQQWVTIIELKYKKEFEDSILKQLKSLKPELLLFLNHTTTITISGNEDEEQRFVKKDLKPLSSEVSRVSLNGIEWNVFYSGEGKMQGEKEKYYSYKVAWNPDLSYDPEKSWLYSYFPTQIKTNLPYLIHGTFELDPTRNYLNDNDDNKFLLGKIAESLGDIAVNYLKNTNESDWKAYQFITTLRESENELLQPFYEKFAELRKSLDVYPCVDGSYTNLEEAHQYHDDFPFWVMRNDLGHFFNNLLKPSKFDIESSKNYPPEKLVEIFTLVSPEIKNLKERVKLIKLLTYSDFWYFHKKSEFYLPLLLNSTDDPILDDRLVFAQDKGKLENYNLPTGIRIEFISSAMLELLKVEFSEEIDRDTETKESKGRNRSLKRLIGDIVNLGSDDINELIRYIVKEASNIHKDNQDPRWIKDMVQSLFMLFTQKSHERESKLQLDIPLLSRNLEKTNASKLFFGKEYERGKLTEEIFEGVYTSNDFLLSPEDWEFEEEEPLEVENFFSWLGVNKFLRFDEIDIITFQLDDYLNFVSKHITMPDLVTSWTYKGKRIKNIEVIKQLSAEKLVLLILKENEIRNRLERENDNELTHKYGNKSATPIYNKPSYIEYQIVSKSSFHDFLVEEEIGFVNSFSQFRYDHPLLTKYGVSEYEVKDIITKLGAINGISGIAVSKFYELFETVDPKDSQTFYRRFFQICTSRKINEVELEIDFSKLRCYARQGGKGKSLELMPVKDIIYTDNTLVPQKILDDYWILNLPKRMGEQNVKKFFGVKLLREELSDVEINVHQYSFLNTKFQSYIDELKVYFLCYRLTTVNTPTQEKTESDAIKKLKINLVTDCSYSFGSKSQLSLDENSFLAKGDTYYLKSSIVSDVRQLKAVPEICDAIAEILSIQFKVKEHKNSFRSIFKDGISDTKHLIKKDELEQHLEKARLLLGVSNEELIFWKNVFRLNDLELEEYQEKGDLQKVIENKLHYVLPDDYIQVDFSNLSKPSSYHFLIDLNEKLEVPIERVITWDTNGFQEHYKLKLKDVFNDKNKKFEQLLWNEVLKLNKKENFIGLLNEYESLIEHDLVIKTLNENKLLLNWDVEDFAINIIESHFKIQWADVDEADEIKNHYVEILKEFRISEDELDLHTRSLLFFKGNEEKLREKLQNSVDLEKEDTDLEKQTKLKGKLIYNVKTKPSQLKATKSSGKTKIKGWTHGQKDINKNKKSGQIAEKTVYDSLVDTYGEENVKWVSGYSDTPNKSDEMRYDIRYKKSNGEWYFLEVKAFNGQYFYLSRLEKEFAEQNNDRHEIALVQGEDIHIFPDFFDENVDFDSNDKFTATPGDYLISLKIEDDR